MRVSHWKGGTMTAPMAHARSLTIWVEKGMEIGFLHDNHAKKIVSQVRILVNFLKLQVLVIIGTNGSGSIKKSRNASALTGVGKIKDNK